MIKKLYSKVRKNHPDMIDLDNQKILELEKIYLEQQDSEKTKKYIIATSLSLIFIGYFPYLISLFFNYALHLEKQLSIYLNFSSFILKNIIVLISIILLLFYTVFYTLIMPNNHFYNVALFKSKKRNKSKILTFINNLGKKRKDQQPILEVNKKDIRFILFMIFVYYLATLIIIILGYSFLSENLFVKYLTIIWISIPLIIITLAPYILIAILIVTFFLLRGKRKEYK